MAGLADVFNLTLSYLGQNETIDNPAAETNTCKTLNRFWPTARDRTLRDFPWSFARKIRVAAQRAQDVPGWQYTYDYPSDAIFVLAVCPESGVRSPGLWWECWQNYVAQRPQRYPFERFLSDSNQGQVIVTDLPQAYLLQITRVTNPAVYDIGFVSTAAADLASLVAPSLQAKPEWVKIARDIYEIERAKATANDFNEGHPDAEPETPSIAARG